MPSTGNTKAKREPQGGFVKGDRTMTEGTVCAIRRLESRWLGHREKGVPKIPGGARRTGEGGVSQRKERAEEWESIWELRKEERNASNGSDWWRGRRGWDRSPRGRTWYFPPKFAGRNVCFFRFLLLHSSIHSSTHLSTHYHSICLSIDLSCPSFCPFAHPSFYPSVHPPHPSIHPSTDPSTSPLFCPFTCPSIHPCTHLLIHPFTHSPVHPLTYSPTRLSIHPATHLSTPTTTNPPFYPPTHPSTHPQTYHLFTHPILLFFHLPIHPSTNPAIHQPTHWSIHLFTDSPTLSVCPFIHPQIHPSIYPFIYSFSRPLLPTIHILTYIHHLSFHRGFQVAWQDT